MKRLAIAVAGVLVLLASARPMADISVSIIEYRVLAALGQVRLTTGFVHDPGLQEKMLKDLAGFDSRGLIAIDGPAPRRVNRRETIGTHVVETAIVISPPLGRGYKGGVASAQITVTVDDKIRISCPYDAGDIELADISILPIDGMISVRGNVNGKQFDGLTVLSSPELVDARWLQQHAR